MTRIIVSDMSMTPEPWQVVGTAAGSAYQGSWAPLSYPTYPRAEFYRDPFGLVRMKGLISGGGANQNMIKLPDAYGHTVDNYHYHVFASTGGALTTITISQTGMIGLGATYSGWVDLASIPAWRCT